MPDYGCVYHYSAPVPMPGLGSYPAIYLTASMKELSYETAQDTPYIYPAE